MSRSPELGLTRPARDVAHADPTVRAVTTMRAAYRAASLPFDLPGTGPLRPERARIVEQFDDYLLPRLARADAPLLVVVGGPTGVGKSTLVNSLVGHRVTQPGVLRPTTRSPVLVHHPEEAHWFGAGRLLPTLDRVDAPTHDHSALQLVAAPTVPPNLAILDAPDFDSIDDGNRQLAARLLGAADLWLFVTSSNRYSDQLPWQHLEAALSHDLPVAVVMNRIPDRDRGTVSGHLARMLEPLGVAAERTFFVGRREVDGDGLLPGDEVHQVRRFLTSLAADAPRRADLVDRAVRGGLARAVETGRRLADGVAEQIVAVDSLLTVADQTYADVASELQVALSDGGMVRGGLLARWRDFVGVDEVGVDLTVTMTALRQRLQRGDVTSAEVEQLGLALDLSLETLVTEHAERAAERTSAALLASAHGEALLAWSEEDLTRAGRGLAGRVRREAGAWRRGLATRVAAEQGTGSEGTAADVAACLAIALVLHAVSPGGAQAQGALPVAAREGVTAVVHGLLLQERDRYLQPVLAWELTPDAPDRLRAAAREVARLAPSRGPRR